MEETGVPRENHWPVVSHWHTLSHNVVSSTPRHERDSNAQLYVRSVSSTPCHERDSNAQLYVRSVVFSGTPDSFLTEYLLSTTFSDYPASVSLPGLMVEIYRFPGENYTASLSIW